MLKGIVSFSISILMLITPASSMIAQTREFKALEQDNAVVITLQQIPNFETYKKIYMASFFQAYKSCSEQDLGIDEPLEEHLEHLFLKHFEEINSHPEHFICFEAQKNKEVVGYAVFKRMDNSDWIYLSTLLVDPLAQRLGIGKKLMFSVLKTEPCINKIILNTRRVNSKAISFYKKLGFVDSTYIDKTYMELAPILVGLELNI